LRSFGTQEF